MACRRSQVRSLSGPPFELIRTRREAGFLLACFEQAQFASVAAREGASVSKIHMSKRTTSTVIYYNKYMSFYKDRVFWFIFVALALVKIFAFLGIYFFHPLGETVLSFPDSLSYVYPAVTLLQDGHLWDLYTVSPMLFRTPGYPVFLALVQLLFHNMTWAVALVQNVLSLLLLIPIYLSAKQLAGKGAARWATAFCAASTLYFSLSFAVLSEILCTFLLAWFVFFLLQFLINPQGKTLLCSALFLSAAVYVRPAAYYFFIPMTVLLVCFALTRWIRFSIYKIGVCFLVPVLCLLGMWHLRNAVQTGFSGFTTVGAYNLYFWNSDYVAHKYHLSVQQAQTLLQEALPAGFSSRTPRQQNQIYKAAARPLLRESFTYKLTRAPSLVGSKNFARRKHHTPASFIAGRGKRQPQKIGPAGEPSVGFTRLDLLPFVRYSYGRSVFGGSFRCDWTCSVVEKAQTADLLFKCLLLLFLGNRVRIFWSVCPLSGPV